MITLICPHCESRVWLISERACAHVTCPVCHRNFKLDNALRNQPHEQCSLKGIFERLPLADVGSREKELILTERDFSFLGRAVLTHILTLEEWELSSKNELQAVIDRIGELISLMEERGQDTRIIRLEYDLLNAFVRNFFD